MQDEQSPPPARTLILYTDYSCPFSYILKSVVERYIQTAVFPPKIEYHMFDLNETVRTQDGHIDRTWDSPQENYSRRVQVSVDILSEQRAVFVNRNPPTDIDSWPAQKISYWIKREYPKIVFETFYDEVFTEMWSEKRDISERSVLKDIIQRIGIKRTKVDEIFDDDDFDAEFRAYLRRIKQQIPRVSPTLVYQEQTICGAVSLSDVRRLVKFAKGHPADEWGLNLIPHYNLPQHHQ